MACSDHKGAFPQKPYKYPGELGTILRDVERFNNWGSVYFSTHLYSGVDTSTKNTNYTGQRVKEKAKPLTCLWIDLDNGNPQVITPQPTICWATSENRYQAVWLLDRPANPQQAEEINKYLTYTNGGDKGKWALTTYLRLPITKNFKHNPVFQGHFLWADGPVYSLDELLPPKDYQADIVSANLESDDIPSSLPSLASVYQQYGKLFSPVLWELLNKSPTAKDDWSEKLWQIEKLLLEAGLPLPAAFVICQNSKWNKFDRDGRPSIHLWQDLLKARSETKGVEVSTGLLWTPIDDLMGYTRKPEWLVEDIWMEANVGWIAGVGKSYKSTLSLDLALSIASGKPFLGRYKVLKPGPVLMVQEEDPKWRVSRRLQAMFRQKNLSPMTVTMDMYGLNLQIDKEVAIPLYSCISGGCILTDPEKLYAVEAAIQEFKPKYVLLDPWYQMAAGLDEFKAGEVTNLLVDIKQWRNKYDCAVGIVHHYRKGSGTDGRDRLYGSMAFYAWSENSLFVSRKQDTNMVIVQRDIKDAPTEKPIIVEFKDIDEDYIFNLVDSTELPRSTPAEDKLVSFLLSLEAGDKISRSDIVEATGLSSKTISLQLKELEAEQLVVLSYEGRGNQMYAIVQDALLEGRAGFGL